MNQAAFAHPCVSGQHHWNGINKHRGSCTTDPNAINGECPVSAQRLLGVLDANKAFLRRNAIDYGQAYINKFLRKLRTSVDSPCL
jgi:hypothetical protein